MIVKKRFQLFGFEGAKPEQRIPVVITQRSHLFPYRTQKLSFGVPKILGWRRPGKIGRCRIYITVLRETLELCFITARSTVYVVQNGVLHAQAKPEREVHVGCNPECGPRSQETVGCNVKRVQTHTVLSSFFEPSTTLYGVQECVAKFGPATMVQNATTNEQFLVEMQQHLRSFFQKDGKCSSALRAPQKNSNLYYF